MKLEIVPIPHVPEWSNVVLAVFVIAAFGIAFWLMLRRN